MAGYETTANATTYMLYMLAKNPDVQDKLRQYFEDEKNKEEVVDYFEMVSLKCSSENIDHLRFYEGLV